MSNTADPELCSFITNAWRSLQNFDFPETEQPFKFVWFEEGFPWICFSRLQHRNYYLSCVLFGHKYEENLYKNRIKHGTQQQKH